MEIRQFNKVVQLIVIILVVNVFNIQLLAENESLPETGWITCDITFIGEASGGELILL